MSNGPTLHDRYGRLWARHADRSELIDARPVGYRVALSVVLWVDGEVVERHSLAGAKRRLEQLRAEEPSDLTVHVIKTLEIAIFQAERAAG